MRQGITTKYLGPTNNRGPRIKATARKASGWGKEMSLTVPFDYEGTTESRHTFAAKALATKLGWKGLWVGGGAPSEDGYHYVNVNSESARKCLHPAAEGADWFYVA